MKATETTLPSNLRRHAQQDHRSKARWLSYVTATGAAALGAGESEAVTLQFAGPGTVGPNGSVALDLNGDLVDDVTIFNLFSTSYYGTSYGGRAGALGSVLAAYGQYGGSAKFIYAQRFSNFSSITPTFSPPSPASYDFGIYEATSSAQGYLRDYTGFPLSGWAADPSAGLLGVRFDIGGNSHMGFVEIAVDTSDNTQMFPGNVPSIISFGYETEPDTALSNPIPEPTSLGLLAFGATGLAGLRRRRRRTETE